MSRSASWVSRCVRMSASSAASVSQPLRSVSARVVASSISWARRAVRVASSASVVWRRSVAASAAARFSPSWAARMRASVSAAWRSSRFSRNVETAARWSSWMRSSSAMRSIACCLRSRAVVSSVSIARRRFSSSSCSLPSWPRRSRWRSSSVRTRDSSFSWPMMAMSPSWTCVRRPSRAFWTCLSSVFAVTRRAIASERSCSSLPTISSRSRISRFWASTPAPCASREPPATTPSSSTRSPSSVTRRSFTPRAWSSSARSS